MDEEKKIQLKKTLEDYHTWPSVYMFKFIFPSNEETMLLLKQKFPDEVEYDTKQSSNGKYTSVTVKEMILKAETVFIRYDDVSTIEGIFSI